MANATYTCAKRTANDDSADYECRQWCGVPETCPRLNKSGDESLALGAGEVNHNAFRVWPDGTVQEWDEVPYSHMSDDFIKVWAENADEAQKKGTTL